MTNRKSTTAPDFAHKEVARLNRILDREWTNPIRMAYVVDRITWLSKFRKVPTEILSALTIKTTAMFSGDWYGNEPEERTIMAFISK